MKKRLVAQMRVGGPCKRDTRFQDCVFQPGNAPFAQTAVNPAASPRIEIGPRVHWGRAHGVGNGHAGGDGARRPAEQPDARVPRRPAPALQRGADCRNPDRSGRGRAAWSPRSPPDLLAPSDSYFVMTFPHAPPLIARATIAPPIVRRARAAIRPSGGTSI